VSHMIRSEPAISQRCIVLHLEPYVTSDCRGRRTRLGYLVRVSISTSLLQLMENQHFLACAETFYDFYEIRWFYCRILSVQTHL